MKTNTVLKNSENVEKTMPLAKYEKRNGQKVVSCGQIICFWVPWTLYLVTS